MDETPAISPVLKPGTPPPQRQQPVPRRVADKRWTFSFRFWKQIEFFGLSQSDRQWLVSLLERLKDLSDLDLDRFLADFSARDFWRYHNIDWNQKNIPIQRKDLNWLPEDIRQNDEEFPLVQFQISKSLGRVVGFFDENSVFEVVLLDPLHNMQPAKSHDYRVDPCSPLRCDYSLLIDRLDAAINGCPQECSSLPRIREIPDRRRALNAFNVLVMSLSDSNMQYARQLLDGGKAASLVDIFEAGLLVLDD